ncbi:hypothetical protein BofuT4_P032740.1 [Botrytis cinerea T4]|uniref:Uncharacterized protein n=1 Tax=Botryotinia fuckeliana (strain T4) TaxID=999810 RepID=G2Y8D6_BOTF4|nr:hypothetical protein BofuT4_P032740.1 [Botrytis cinerea T4]
MLLHQPLLRQIKPRSNTLLHRSLPQLNPRMPTILLPLPPPQQAILLLPTPNPLLPSNRNTHLPQISLIDPLILAANILSPSIHHRPSNPNPMPLPPRFLLRKHITPTIHKRAPTQL